MANEKIKIIQKEKKLEIKNNIGCTTQNGSGLVELEQAMTCCFIFNKNFINRAQSSYIELIYLVTTTIIATTATIILRKVFTINKIKPKQRNRKF